MKVVRSLKAIVIGISCWGVVFPQSQVLADGPAKTRLPVIDVAASATGAVTGQLLNRQGVGIENAPIVFLQGKSQVATAITGKNGVFQVAKLTPGAYIVAMKNQAATCRVWAANTAPPAAHKKMVLVANSTVVRGQNEVYYDGGANCGAGTGLDIITLVTLGTAVTAVTLSAITLSKINDVESKVDALPATP